MKPRRWAGTKVRAFFPYDRRWINGEIVKREGNWVRIRFPSPRNGYDALFAVAKEGLHWQTL